ncbi:DUF1150 family protein [Martelella mediterranea]|uniref:DUF1150 family protein n=1 Tax=Martelella mediterranea TaxID=293089 RepID=A0A4R3NX54_9HYPH|nr:DUF1150 family protein [Martelella mediterranea]TCT43051.1 hypothetical protein EDC90_100358 [Martelella mediterranea]
MEPLRAEICNDTIHLASLGAGHIGYFRELALEEAIRQFPDAANLHSKADSLWALFDADGSLILLTENRTSIFFKAMEDDIKTATLH